MAMFEGVRNFWREFRESFRDQEIGLEDPELIRTEILDLVEPNKFKKRIWFVASSGFFADTYSLFATNVITPALAYIYWPCETRNVYGTSINGVTLAGSCIGMLVFGHLADRLGRTSLYGTELVIAIIATIGATQLGSGYNQQSMLIVGWIVFWRFLLGIGIGAEYPLSALIASEWSSTQSRGRMLAAVFFVQPLGQLSAYAIGYFALLGIAKQYQLSHNELDHEKAAPVIDRVWRVVIGVGALTSLFAIALRVTIPETPRWLLTKRPKAALQSAMKIYPNPNSLMNRRSAPGDTGAYGTELKNMVVKESEIGKSLLHSPDGQDRNSLEITASSSRDPNASNLSRNEVPNQNRQSQDDALANNFRHQGSNESQVHNAPEPREGKCKWWREWKAFLAKGYNMRILIGLSICWCLLDVAFYGIGLDSPRAMAKIWAPPPTSTSNGTAPAVFTGSFQCRPTGSGELYDWQSDLENYDTGIVETLLWDSKRALLTTSIASVVGSLIFLVGVNYVPRVATLIGTFIALAFIFLIAGTSLIAAYEEAHYSVIIVLYAFALLIFNVGPNTITFMLPAELFPTKYRGTCYGIAAASGKLGAFVVQIIARVAGVTNPEKGKWPLIGILLVFWALMLLGALVAWTCIPEVQHPPGTRLDGRGNPRTNTEENLSLTAKRRMPPRSLESIEDNPVPNDQILGFVKNVQNLFRPQQTLRSSDKKSRV